MRFLRPAPLRVPALARCAREPTTSAVCLINSPAVTTVSPKPRARFADFSTLSAALRTVLRGFAAALVARLTVFSAAFTILGLFFAFEPRFAAVVRVFAVLRFGAALRRAGLFAGIYTSHSVARGFPKHR